VAVLTGEIVVLNEITILSYDKKIVNKRKTGKYTFFQLEDGSEISSSQLYKERISIKCHMCGSCFEINFYQGKNGLLKRKYKCFVCLTTGSNNPFYGKKHSEEFKNKLSVERKGKWYIGSKNKMYGRCIWRELSFDKLQKAKDKLRRSCSGKRNGFYGMCHSDEVKKILSVKSKAYIDNNPDHLKKMIECSLKKQSSGFKSKIEIRVEEELFGRKIKHKYSKILHRKYQYDFFINENILLEVHGDYWHANPLFYGPGKKPLNHRQKYKIEQDSKKKEFAEKYGYRIFYIWETEIKNNNFSVMDKIEGLINGQI
jgi:G:T-mismatch repair DNA endonuclease (very short patch repair protein)